MLNRERDYVAEALAAPRPIAKPQTPRPSWRDNVMSAPDLCDKKFPELKFIVPGLFPEGVTLIVSRPKLGKSWLLLQIGGAIANGVHVLASGDHPPLQGDVLYLNLEDGDRKAQRRMARHFGALRQNWPGRMTIARNWRRFDQGGIDDLREWCKSVEKPTLINIDTLKRVRAPKKAGQTDYDADYEACQGLLQLAHEVPGLAFFVAHHDRKMDAEDVFDTVSGTLGLIGGVDTIAVLKRKAQGVTLHIEGRDLVDSVEKAIQFDRETCRWQILGEAAEFNRSAERTRVLNALKDAHAGLSVSEIKAAADIQSREATDKLLQRMAVDGQAIRLARGRYGHPDIGHSTVPLSEVVSDDKPQQNRGEVITSDTSDTTFKVARPDIPLSEVSESQKRGQANDCTYINGAATSDTTSDASDALSETQEDRAPVLEPPGTCLQCGGTDGKTQHMGPRSSSKPIWLHRECVRFWAER